MSKLGKKIAVVGIWASIGVLIGLQFGGGGDLSSPVSPWAAVPGAAGTAAVNGPAAGTASAAGVQAGGTALKGEPQAIIIDGRTYIYVPPVPGKGESDPAATGGQLPEGTADYGTLTPAQILLPQDELRPTVDVFADKTANLLQRASQQGIRWVASLFAPSAE